MKRSQVLFPIRKSLPGAALGVALTLLAVQRTAAENAQPMITGIRVTSQNVVITAHVPAGLKKVTLQCSRRLGTGAWEPRAVLRLDGQGGEVQFDLPRSPELEIVRVRADETEPLPAKFYQGTNVFPGVPVSTTTFPGPVLDAAGPGAVDNRNAANEGGGQRDVVESDIWKLEGDVLYFFNQNRGLQVMDVGNPDLPVLRGTLPLAAAGEQMYLLPEHRVVLLARNGCAWSADAASQVLLVDTAGATPRVLQSLPIGGDIQESRLVGTALYVLTQSYRPVADSKDGDWEWGTAIYAFDLSDPLAPASRSSFWYSGYGNVLSATDRYLFIAVTDNAGQSRVHCVNISAPDGTMTKAGTIPVAGRVPDKFKMNESDDVLTVISEKWTSEFSNGTGRWRPVTKLETFSLASAKPEKLGELELADGEQLHATRFDGQRVYVVTFFRVDPLWVVDLSDPRKPAITGELEVPGWSTYIQPYGDRLVAVGIDNTNGWKVAVSLFDVHDPAAPALLSKVPLGEDSSWSEANSDEKAFGFLPDAGLILIPYSTYTTSSQQGVQLIDFSRDALVKRGFINHDVPARRSTVHQNRILSISGRELLSVDATDRDRPVVKSELELAWPVNRVFVQGDYLVELESSVGWGTSAAPAVRVVSRAAPDGVVNALPLSNLPVLGATYQDGRLHLLQGLTTYVPVLVPAEGGKEVDQGTNQTKLVSSVIDLSKLPALAIVGSAERVTGDSLSGSADAAWPKPGVLVWVTQQYGYWGPWWGVADVARGVATSPIRGGFWSPWGAGESRMLAVDVSSPSAPQFVSEVNLSTTNGWASFSKPFVADHSIFLTRQLTEVSILGTNFVVVTNLEYVVETNGVGGTGSTPDASGSTTTKPEPVPGSSDNATRTVARTVVVTNEQPIYVSKQLSFLEVVDYAAPGTPVRRQPATVPGGLRGLSQNGALLYLVGYKPDAKDVTDGTEWLHACAYDGVSTFLVDSHPLPVEWPHPLLVHEARILISRPEVEKTSSRALETWTLSESGQFSKLGERSLAGNATALEAIGDLLVVQEEVGLELFDLGNPLELPLVGADQPSGCFGWDPAAGAGSVRDGLWLPLDVYGVYHIAPKR